MDGEELARLTKRAREREKERERERERARDLTHALMLDGGDQHDLRQVLEREHDLGEERKVRSMTATDNHSGQCQRPDKHPGQQNGRWAGSTLKGSSGHERASAMVRFDTGSAAGGGEASVAKARSKPARLSHSSVSGTCGQTHAYKYEFAKASKAECLENQAFLWQPRVIKSAPRREL